LDLIYSAWIFISVLIDVTQYYVSALGEYFVVMPPWHAPPLACPMPQHEIFFVELDDEPSC
jgi:hypothetical protein